MGNTLQNVIGGHNVHHVYQRVPNQINSEVGKKKQEQNNTFEVVQ